MTTTEIDDFDELVARLTALGDRLDVDDLALVDTVLERLAEPSPAARRSYVRPLLIAAAIALLVLGVVLTPATRTVVARWLGLDGVVIVVDPALPTPSTADASTPISELPPIFEAPGPGESRVVVVDGREILVSTIEGSLNDQLITKVVGATDQVEAVEVMGYPGLWVSGAAHEVMYELDGDVIVERMAADTLLWNDGVVLHRVEGFDDLADALAFVEGT